MTKREIIDMVEDEYGYDLWNYEYNLYDNCGHVIARLPLQMEVDYE